LAALQWHKVCEIKGILRSALGGEALISATQQQARWIGCFLFHRVELFFNSMIICNIYHSAVRKIRL
jgi:hypothetical protein